MATRCAVPFVPSIKAGKNEAQQAAEQLTKMIEKWDSEGWRFCHLEAVTTLRNNGCIAGFFGNPTSVISFQLAVLER